MSIQGRLVDRREDAVEDAATKSRMVASATGVASIEGCGEEIIFKLYRKFVSRTIIFIYIWTTIFNKEVGKGRSRVTPFKVVKQKIF